MNGKGKIDKEPGSETKSTEDMSGMMASCCGDTQEGGPEGMAEMMAKCCHGMKGCRWFPLFPVLVGASLFLLGYFLDAGVVRVLWLVVSGAIVLMGFVGVIMMGMMLRK